jgi:hypothetical protein
MKKAEKINRKQQKMAKIEGKQQIDWKIDFYFSPFTLFFAFFIICEKQNLPKFLSKSH